MLPRIIPPIQIVCFQAVGFEFLWGAEDDSAVPQQDSPHVSAFILQILMSTKGSAENGSDGEKNL